MHKKSKNLNILYILLRLTGITILEYLTRDRNYRKVYKSKAYKYQSQVNFF